MRKRQGFTLIELLVVIAIIAILAAILFPVFALAKAKANESRCSNNLKQIGTATAMYMSDYGDRYPPYKVIDPNILNSNVTGAWFTVVVKYSKSKLLARCPSDTKKYATDANQSQLNAYKVADYWRNAYTNYWSGQFSPMSPQEGAITYKRSTVYLMDGTAWSGATDLPSHHNWWGPPTTWSTDQHCVDAERRHSGGANVLFCDWHIKLVRPDEFQSTNLNTANDPLVVGNYALPTGKWARKNDGSHPWFRGD